jgi:hypothetical protein
MGISVRWARLRDAKRRRSVTVYGTAIIIIIIITKNGCAIRNLQQHDEPLGPLAIKSYYIKMPSKLGGPAPVQLGYFFKPKVYTGSWSLFDLRVFLVFSNFLFQWTSTKPRRPLQ